MKDSGTHREDENWKALLRANTPEPPFDDVNWTVLHARIIDRARPLVQHTRKEWWQHVAGWSARGIPAAAAAAAIVMLLVSDVVRPSASAASEVRTIEQALAAALPDDSMPLLLEADDMADALLFHGVE